ncbi:MAG: PAS domain S-box protein [Euryarchaeota archaeon]|nr:PAS domain S-box protein [Euryarchaeota archaeon]
MSGSPSLRELIDIDELQSIQDSFARAAGISSVIFSPEGEPLTRFTNPTGFCSLIQSTEKGKERCFQSFMEMGEIALLSEEPEICYCFAHGGHFVAPIIIDGEHKGTMFAGQFIPEKFSSEQLHDLEEIAPEIDIDQGSLVQEAGKMRVVGEDVIRNYSILLFKIVELIARRGAQAAELGRVNDTLKKAHEALGLRFRDVAGTMSDWVWEVDADARYTYCSEKVKDVLGYSVEEMIGKTPFDFILHDGNESAGAAFAEIVRERHPFRSMENWLRTRDGRSVCMLTSGVPILDDAGELLGYRGVDSDITEQKKAEEALKDRVEFEEIVTAISTSFINLAPDEIGAGIEDALGSIGEFVGVDRSYVFQLFDGGTAMDNTHEWCARGIVPLIENLKGLQTADFPWSMAQLNRFGIVHIPVVADLPPDANVIKETLQSQDILSVILVPMVYGGTLIGYLGFDSVRQEKRWSEDDIALLKVVGDIFVNALERRRAEGALQESEEKLRTITDSANDAIIMMDHVGNTSYWNKAAEQMFGYTEEEVIGKELHALIVPERFHAAFSKGFEGFKETGQGDAVGKTLELAAFGKDGKEFPVELSLSGVKLKGRWNAIGLLRDTTERKAAEEEIKKKADELEKFNRLAVGRELKMIELKKEINALLEKSGKEHGYKIVGEL